jgi:hypothetical protein
MRRSFSLSRTTGLALAAILLAFPGAAVPQTAQTPDVLGLRAGASAQEAYNLLKAWGKGSKVGVGMLHLPISQKPVAVIMSTQLQSNPVETMTVWLTLPPDKQVVWAIRHEVKYDPGKEMLTSTALQALDQKYGPEMDPRSHSWFFDEQGQRVAAGPGQGDCNQRDMTNASNVGPDLTAPLPYSPLMSIGDPRQDICTRIIKVNAKLQGPPLQGQLTQVITIILQDMALGHRNQLAYKAALENAGAAQQQDQLNRAGQQKAPTF